MKAVIYTEYGSPDVLQLTEVAKPAPRDHELLIRNYATTVTAGDCRMRRAEPFAARLYNGLVKPRKVNILGFELAGEVEAVGEQVKQFKQGDLVFAFTGFNFGAYAEYKCIPEAAKAIKNGFVAIKPANLTFEESAAIPGAGLTALSILRRGQITQGQKVLVYGASGAVGTYAVQLARYYGAEVTGVTSRANLDLVKSLGAVQVLDYTKEDFIRRDETYDVIFDAVAKLPRARRMVGLKDNGVFLSAHDSSNPTLEDLVFLKELVEAGEIKPVVDRCYPLEQIAEAHRYVDTGHKRGNVVITIAPSRLGYN